MARNIENLVVLNAIDIFESLNKSNQEKIRELELIKFSLNLPDIQINEDIANLNNDIRSCHETIELLYKLINSKTNDNLIVETVKEYLVK